jgi:hypothetical protein
MDLLAAYDPYVIFSLSVGLLLTLCVAVMLLMRDPDSVPPHPVSRRVWCAGRRRSAAVDFMESMVTGVVHRSVRQCSLRDPDGHCDEACRYEPVAHVLREQKHEQAESRTKAGLR